MASDPAITRRELLGGFGALAVGALVGRADALTSASSEGKAESDRPNMVFAIADDWSWPHAGAYGDKLIKTPAFDRVAREGVLFTSSFAAAPTCTASRGAILTGQAPHRLDEGANLHSTLPARFAVYPELLESAGYFIGLTGKGWGPGSVEAGGRKRNPAGPEFGGFAEFLRRRPADKPFCYWLGSHRPHRPYDLGSGESAGLKAGDVTVPPFLPDTPEVRGDLLDYYLAAQQFDAQVRGLLDALESNGLAENTLLVVTSDNGMPFPRAKCNLYQAGTHMPLAVRWPAKIKGGRCEDALISHTDFAPTFLEAAGLRPQPAMTGHSFLGLLLGKPYAEQDCVFCERERHTDRREGRKSYPMRAIRTKDFLYIRNLRPSLWPACDPQPDKADGGFGDIDGSPTKRLLLDRRGDSCVARFFDLACGKRLEEELYDLGRDPWNLTNLADHRDYAGKRRELRARLDEWMDSTEDPRAKGDDTRWDGYAYYGKRQ